MYSSRKRTVIPWYSLFFLFILISFSSCGGPSGKEVERITLFSLPLGTMEDELPLFQFDDEVFHPEVNIEMYEGLFYISESRSKKIMIFNSYGDIIGLIYNPETNPAPVLLQINRNAEEITSRQASPYPFEYVGEIGIFGNSLVLVEDMVGKEREEYDKELDALLNRVILRFDRGGRLLDYLGQEGLGGTPFPYIQRIQVTSHGETVVVCRTMNSWIVYWFSVEGIMGYRIKIPLDNLPVPQGEEYLIAELEDIFADLERRKIYLKLDYYHTAGGQENQPSSGTGFYKSGVFTYDLLEETYTSFIELPEKYRRQVDGAIVEEKREEIIFEFTGVASGGHLYFMGMENVSGNKLLIVNSRGKVIVDSSIVLEEKELLYETFHVTPQGILTAVLCDEIEANVVWWRTDQFIDEENQEEEE